jgi:2'-5' RNA ligase
LNSREEGEYTPHMTFARLRNPGKSKDLLSPFVRKDFGKVDVTEVILYESIIKTPYTFYKEIARIPLTAVTPMEEI